MTSERKIAANRRNAAKSTGPRTRGGRATASRNALRHGLRRAAVDHGHEPEDVERIARLIAADESGGIRYEQAIIIAESSLLISRIRAFRVKAIERFRERIKSPFFAGSPLPQEIDGLARLHGLGNTRAARDVIGRWAKATEAGNKELKASVKELRRRNVARLIAFGDSFEKGSPKPRTDAECFLLAFSEISALDRHERRALSRRRRAVRTFDALSASV
jgi:phosphoglycolate phosphatase-like HAD superfamily hydrolase